MEDRHSKDRSPCKECPDREIGCHGKCEKYLAWKEENDRRRINVQEGRKRDNDAIPRAVRYRWNKKKM